MHHALLLQATHSTSTCMCVQQNQQRHSRLSMTTAAGAHLVQHAGLGHERLTQRLAAPQLHLLSRQHLLAMDSSAEVGL